MKINSIDIIIPVYKPGKSFESLLVMLKRQSVPFAKLIVFITDPSKETKTGQAFNAGDFSPGDIEKLILEVFDDSRERLVIRHVREEDFDHAGTRRKAVKLSDADAFICMTDDALPKDMYLIEKLKEALQRDERIALAYARQLPKDDADAAEKHTRNFNYPPQSLIKSEKDLKKYGIKTYFSSNVCCAYNRGIYEKLGGFIESAVFNEDMIYAATALKCGYFSYYKADALVIHSHSYSAFKEFKRSFDQGMNQAMHPEIFGGISSESEGLRYVKDTVRYLMKKGHILSLPGFILKAGSRYMGFKLGKAYKVLPGNLVSFFSMNKYFVKRLAFTHGQPPD